MKRSLATLPLLVATFGLTLAHGAVAGEFQDPAWRFTLKAPGANWQTADFDDNGWKQGPGGFGTRSTPGARIGTEWSTRDIWLRRTVNLPAIPQRPALLVHHDEDAEVFLNGKQVAAFEGYVTEYKVVPLDEDGKQALAAGKNLLAVHCRQTTGGQFIDVHLIDADSVPKLPAPPRDTRPFQSELITKWGAQVTPENAWTEYPRPGMARDDWQNLNGLWDYAVTSDQQTSPPEAWDGQILVPYCIESKLSGVQRLLDPSEALWYHRTFQTKVQPDQRLLLNFEAVDHRCRVWVNGDPVGEHAGGNVPFQFDITDALKDGDNQLIVRVEDETGGSQLRGKQTLNPRGIWYTRVSGLWQTVWLEAVAPRHIEDLKITTDAEAGSITVTPKVTGGASQGEQLRVIAYEGDAAVAESCGPVGTCTLTITQPRLWSPDSPFLYDLQIALLDAEGDVVDCVDSYAGIRSVGKMRDSAGHLRFTLNGKMIFHLGTLDQGWWPDGLLTPPSDEAMQADIAFLKAAGFNMVRNHIKVKPRRYYYHCDRVGLMIWQDHVSGGKGARWTRLQPNPTDAEWSAEDHAQFMRELEAMIDTLENHPCIVVWVPFNEAWGQHLSMEVGRWVAERDPTRLVNIASGGNFWPVGDVADAHSYPHPSFPFEQERYDDFIKVVGEFGGHGLPVPGHLWDPGRRNWGYGGLPEHREEYKDRYCESMRLLAELKAKGIAGGVYTQTSDVEGEINGLLTYDRKVAKIPARELAEIHQALTD